MNYYNQQQVCKITIEEPHSRRCSNPRAVSSNAAMKASDEASFDSYIAQLNQDEIAAISNRLLASMEAAENYVSKIQLAFDSANILELENQAAQLATLSADLGAIQLMRVCYKIMILTRQGQLEALAKPMSELEQELFGVKKHLRIA